MKCNLFLHLLFPPSLYFKLGAEARERSSMENRKVKLGEMQQQEIIIHTPESSKSNYSSSTPSSNFTFEADLLPTVLPREWFEFQRHLITEKLEDMLLKYKTCFLCLQEAFAEENLLQKENLELRSENLSLSVLVTAKENEILTESIYPPGEDQSSGEKIRSVKKEAQKAGKVPPGFLPKRISVRSKEFLPAMNKIINQAVVSGGDSGSSKESGTTGSHLPLHRLRLAAKPSKDGEQGEGIELDVYKQGMSKTELCNKWEETGDCPYRERCQFAHGVKELRPVLRHPRYKTEICRMIISGGTCPYGHRCHFRHALDPNQENQVVL